MNCSEGWTAGAQRAVTGAGKLAHLVAARSVEPIHLLWALLLEESRASQRLDNLGVGPTEAGLPVELHHADLAKLAAPHEPLPWEDTLHLVMSEAALLAARDRAGDGDVATEHLLDALYRSAEKMTAVLQPFFEAQNRSSLATTERADSLEPDSGVWTHPPLDDWDSSARGPLDTDRSSVYRILDAAANRAREGLRVWEDFARFARNDRASSSALKQARHDLAAALSSLPLGRLLASRDTPHDVGTTISTVAEGVRANPAAVAVAAAKRSQEAVRSLEEFAKVESAYTAAKLEQLRYRLYTLEKATLGPVARGDRLRDAAVCLLLTDAFCPHGAGVVLRAALDAGVNLIQLREKSMPDRERLDRARHARTMTRDAGALLIINDRPDLAVLCDADGVHLGQTDLSIAEARAILGPDRLIGRSTHSLEQARHAVLEGADYLGVGPTFPSTTKAFEEFPGLDFVRQVSEEIAIPWFAIGGISLDNAGEVVAAGASRVAVSSAICQAESPLDAARRFIELASPLRLGE